MNSIRELGTTKYNGTLVNAPISTTEDINQTSQTVRQEEFVQCCRKEHGRYIRERSKSCIFAPRSFHTPY
jgi:hypothetical protein